MPPTQASLYRMMAITGFFSNYSDPNRNACRVYRHWAKTISNDEPLKLSLQSSREKHVVLDVNMDPNVILLSDMQYSLKSAKCQHIEH